MVDITWVDAQFIKQINEWVQNVKVKTSITSMLENNETNETNVSVK